MPVSPAVRCSVYSLTQPSVWLGFRWLIVCGVGFLLGSNPIGLQAQFFPELIWQRFYGTAGNDSPHALAKGPNGELYMAGAVPDDGGCTDGWLARVDSDGQVAWTQRVGSQGCDAIHSMTVDETGHVLFSGVAGSYLLHPEEAADLYKADYFVGRCQANGQLDWRKTFGGTQQDISYGIAHDGQGGAMVVGSCWSRDYDAKSNNAPLNNLWMVGTNRFGQFTQSHFYGGRKNDWGQAIGRLSDGFVVAGFTNSEDLDGSKSRHNGDAWIIRTDRDGTQRWSVVVKEPYEDVVSALCTTPEDHTVIVGSAFDVKLGKQFWFLRLDAQGKVMANRKWGGRGLEHLTAVAPTRDGGFILAGYSYSEQLETPYHKGREDFWLIRTTHDGDIIWQQTFGGPDNERGVGVIEYTPGVFYALGVKRNTFHANGQDTGDDFWLIKVAERPCSQIKPQFQTSLNDDRVGANVPIKFYNATQADRFRWDFGDGTISTERAPTHAYTTPGVYMVRLTAYINEGCAVTYSHTKPVIVVK